MSFVESAQGSDFPIQNLPFGAFVRKEGEPSRCGVAIGDQILDLAACVEASLFEGTDYEASFKATQLNAFMELEKAQWHAARQRISELLSADGNSPLKSDADLRAKCLVAQSDVTMVLPCHVGDYTDFYASKEHATNIGTMFRGADNALMPNWTWLPVGYHGRASSVVVSGTDLHRPRGQLQLEGPPRHDVIKRMDFEMEIAFFVGGKENALGTPLTMQDAEDRLFGLTVMNDWSARDVQKWEYVPLGPFGAKNFGTTISPWIVTMEALEPFRVQGPAQDPEPLDYLKLSKPSNFDIALTVGIQSEKMAKEGVAAATVCETNLKYMYWSMTQQLAHHSVTGCNMRAGDLLGSGTISGPTKSSYGSMVELSWGGKEDVQLVGGETRKFLDDGDTVVMTGQCNGDGFKIGFGDATGKVLPPVTWPPQQ